MELYNAKNGNAYYYEKTHGSPTGKLDKCLLGGLFTGILTFLLVGPLVLFSEYGGLTAANPVLDAQLTA